MIRIMVAGLVGGLLSLLYASETANINIPFSINMLVGVLIISLVYSILSYFNLF